jgi:hypothetical protein
MQRIPVPACSCPEQGECQEPWFGELANRLGRAMVVMFRASNVPGYDLRTACAQGAPPPHAFRKALDARRSRPAVS